MTTHNNATHKATHDETAAKPSVGQKIGGTVQELVGKATNNPGKVAEGEAKKHGLAGPPGGPQGYNEELKHGNNPGGPTGEHSINPTHSSTHNNTTSTGHHNSTSTTGAAVGGLEHEKHKHDHNNHNNTTTGLGNTTSHSHTGTGTHSTGLNNSTSHTGTTGHHQIGNQTPFPPGQGEPGLGGHPQQHHNNGITGSHHDGLTGSHNTSTTGGLTGSHHNTTGHSGLGSHGTHGNHGTSSATRPGEEFGIGGVHAPTGHQQGLPLGESRIGGGGPEGLSGTGSHVGGVHGTTQGGLHGQGISGTHGQDVNSVVGHHGVDSGISGGVNQNGVSSEIQPPFGGSSTTGQTGERRY
ncbi:uncharacterized protein L201_003289 [Kwoniella dendrophila CBS 6074]|uniref:Dehydrin n=1 Tax=Kwoniella dendrophila CBS 6074 TaxID=1295534 RepID=A0AAX4JV22_9TREE